jgi:flagellar basal-body rod protein FlgG
MNVGPFGYTTWKTYLATIAQEKRLDVTSNNMANIDTPGFKRDVPIFDGYIVKATKTDFSQGPMQETQDRLDLSLSGPGFFQLDTPSGIRYTRNGDFTRNIDGQLVNMEGHRVMADEDVFIPDNVRDLNVTEDGMLYADGDLLGQLELVEFEDPNVLAKDGYSNFVLKNQDVEPEPAQATTVHQGYLEKSNVNPVMASVNLIDTVRTYEVYQKVIHAFSEIGQKNTNEVGRLT